MCVNITSRIIGEAIETDPQAAYYYAKDVLNGRFPEGEAAIAKDTRWSYYYARDVIGGRWPRGEAAIAKDPQDAYFAYLYARDVLKGRFPKGEPAIAKDNYYAPLYVQHILKEFPEAKLEWVLKGWLDWLDL
jgi:hypothetical protein